MAERRRRERHPDLPADAGAMDIGRCVRKFLDSSGVSTLLKHPELHSAWTEICDGAVCEHTRILSFQRGRLEIGVDTATVMHEIRFRRRELLLAMQARVRNPFVSAITCVIEARRPADEQRSSAQ